MPTISAISTAPGVGGIAVIRVSGPQAFVYAAHHLSKRNESGNTHAHCAFGRFKVNRNIIDEVMVTYYPAPHSYTGEDVIEISCHGSTFVQQQILQAFLEDGARLAEAGEFTRRAFLNGKLDLSQAEAVADLIDSTNAASHALAMSQLRGGYATKLASLREQFVELTSLLELELDFSEEDVEFADRSHLLELVEQISIECQRLCQSFKLGNAIKQGVPVAIVGKPNVGKSTLLNTLVGDDRAIVSDIAGTTRDTIEDQVTIQGINFRFIDTAGIRHSNDQIESAGIERSYKAMRQAQVILYLSDGSQPIESMEQEIAELSTHVNLQDKKLIAVCNKSDLYSTFNLPSQWLSISAQQGLGIDELKVRLIEDYQLSSQNENATVSNLRHYEALQHVASSLENVRQGISQGLTADLLVIDIRDALYHLGTITGQITSDEILGSIFGRFCIGK